MMKFIVASTVGMGAANAKTRKDVSSLALARCCKVLRAAAKFRSTPLVEIPHPAARCSTMFNAMYSHRRPDASLHACMTEQFVLRLTACAIGNVDAYWRRNSSTDTLNCNARWCRQPWTSSFIAALQRSAAASNTETVDDIKAGEFGLDHHVAKGHPIAKVLQHI